MRLSKIGLYRGRVEYVKDPLKIGRAKIRVPLIHGIINNRSSYISTEDLPWASPCFPIGGGFDHGTFILPEVGDTVYVAFEANSDNLVYIGSSFSYNNKIKKYGALEPDDDTFTYVGSSSQWRTDQLGSDAPLDATEVPNNQITRKVIYKSPKGATIYVEERDEEESLVIIDRGGQVIRMDSPISSRLNTDNSERRGTSSIYDELELKKVYGENSEVIGEDFDKLSDNLKGTGKITIMNNSGVSITLDKDKVKINSKSSIDIEGDVNITKNLVVQGAVTANEVIKSTKPDTTDYYKDGIKRPPNAILD